jgi:hypothetical protein
MDPRGSRGSNDGGGDSRPDVGRPTLERELQKLEQEEREWEAKWKDKVQKTKEQHKGRWQRWQDTIISLREKLGELENQGLRIGKTRTILRHKLPKTEEDLRTLKELDEEQAAVRKEKGIVSDRIADAFWISPSPWEGIMKVLEAEKEKTREDLKNRRAQLEGWLKK